MLQSSAAVSQCQQFNGFKTGLLLWSRQIIIFSIIFEFCGLPSSYPPEVNRRFCPDCAHVLCGVFPTVALEGFKHS